MPGDPTTFDERLAAHLALVRQESGAAPEEPVASGTPTILEQVAAFKDELSYVEKRLTWLVQHQKLRPDFVATRRRDLRAALATLKSLQDQQQPQHKERKPQ